MNMKKRVLLAAVALPLFVLADSAPKTFCNPMPIPDMPIGIECWKFNSGDLIPKEKLAPWAWGCWPGPKEGPKYARQFRELADPEIHVWNGAWYLYPSCGLLWKSTDSGGTWQHVKAIEHNGFYAPTIAKFRGKYYLTEAYATLKVADTPEGPFTDLGKFDHKTFLSAEEPTTDFGDPMLFADGDHLYIYLGCVPKEKCLWGTELDPENPRRALRPVKRLVSLDAKERHWMRSPLEGAYVFKRGDTYYFTHAGNSPVTHVYATSVWKGPTPLGPFTPQANNPVFSRGSGCARGGGHGGIFQDEAGDWWTCYTIWPGGGFHAFERVIGLDRIEFDANGDIVPSEPTDEPQWLPSTGRKGPTGWKKIPAKCEAKCASDDNVQSHGEFPNGSSVMEFVFDGKYEIRAFRLVWRDLGLDVHRSVKGGAYQYRIERRENGLWTTWYDASRNDRDMTVDYREASAAHADAVRLVLLGGPKGITAAVKELTVFGN